jgi:hypothetical protein
MKTSTGDSCASTRKYLSGECPIFEIFLYGDFESWDIIPCVRHTPDHNQVLSKVVLEEVILTGNFLI